MRLHTSDIPGAGTDGRIFVAIKGDKKEIGWQRIVERSLARSAAAALPPAPSSLTPIFLPPPSGTLSAAQSFLLPQHAFERGTVDEMTISGSDVGEVQVVGVKMEEKGLGAAWHLALVEARCCGGRRPRRGASAPAGAPHLAARCAPLPQVTHGLTGKTTVFPCKKWFDSSSGDKKVERWLKAGVGEIGPDGQPLPEDAAKANLCQYKVTVYTSDILGAGAERALRRGGRRPRSLPLLCAEKWPQRVGRS